MTFPPSTCSSDALHRLAQDAIFPLLVDKLFAHVLFVRIFISNIGRLSQLQKETLRENESSHDESKLSATLFDDVRAMRWSLPQTEAAFPLARWRTFCPLPPDASFFPHRAWPALRARAGSCIQLDETRGPSMAQQKAKQSEERKRRKHGSGPPATCAKRVTSPSRAVRPANLARTKPEGERGKKKKRREKTRAFASSDGRPKALTHASKPATACKRLRGRRETGSPHRFCGGGACCGASSSTDPPHPMTADSQSRRKKFDDDRHIFFQILFTLPALPWQE